MKLNILGADNRFINLDIDDISIENHINNPSSHINCIVNQQINTDKIYNFYFSGKTDLIIIDAGANIGMFSIHCSPITKIVYAIEPTPSHFQILEKITKNFHNIKPLNCALWKEDIDLDFYEINNNSTANSAVLHTDSNKKISVNGKTLKTIIDEQNITHIDLFKMDIEGAEFEILTDDFIDYCYPLIDNFFIEVHAVHGYCSNFNDCRNKIKQLFENNKYKVQFHNNDGLFIHK